MKYLVAVMVVGLLVYAALTCTAAPPPAADKAEIGQEPQPQKAKINRPVVEVVFVLDTTGSMGGLIQGAKEKIWSIANTIVAGEPKPTVRMGLVAYRDKGDEYVTKRFDLTDNIDKVYDELMSYKADGGGDENEDVNQALDDAINKLSWTREKGVLRVIYLVGDFPPHNEYKDVPTYDKLAKQAIEKGIYINTVLCGGQAGTEKVWREIAMAAEGKFLAIAQDGGVKNVDTPFDKELAAKNAELMKTVVLYGTRGRQAAAGAYNSAVASKAAAAPASGPAADRATYVMNSGRVGEADLAEAVQKGKKLEDVSVDLLTDEMQKQTKEEREAYVKKQLDTRDKINQEIKALSAKREAYIKDKLAKSPTSQPAGFDAKVNETVREQGAKVNIQYK